MVWMSNEPLTISSLLRYILNTAVGSKYTGVLWFLQGLVAVYLIFPVLWHIYHEHYKVFAYIFVILFIFSEGYNRINTRSRECVCRHDDYGCFFVNDHEV